MPLPSTLEPAQATANPPLRVRVLGLPVDLVDMDEAVRRVVNAVERRRADAHAGALRVATLNPEMVMRARRTPELRPALTRVQLSLPDGIGLVRELRRRGWYATRVAGIDLVDRYASRAAALGHRLALVGAAPGVAAAAGAELERRHPGLRVVATDSGDPGAELAARLRAVGVDIVLAAYSMEGQAIFLDRHLDDCGAGAGIGVGGTLDVIAGRLPRAPEPLRQMGLEWLWRLVRQPWRVRRQLDLPRFWWSARREEIAGTH
ncbi:MAG TPA: WecB/TagA/CpsF family glycosyltransferase [Candidatus Dormibacteraeota bacterium]